MKSCSTGPRTRLVASLTQPARHMSICNCCIAVARCEVGLFSEAREQLNQGSRQLDANQRQQFCATLPEREQVWG